MDLGNLLNELRDWLTRFCKRENIVQNKMKLKIKLIQWYCSNNNEHALLNETESHKT